MRLLPLLALLLTAPAVLAAGPVELARQQAAEARARTSELRRQQLSLSAELGALSQRIEQSKGQRGRTSAAALDAALKESQSLSATLTGVAQELAAGERRLEQVQLALLDALSTELTRLRADYDRTRERRERAQLLERMRGLRGESERLRAALPAALIPPAPRGTVDGDDPEDLLEQAMALRDAEDRLQSQLKSVDARLRQARAEAELSRRMDDFIGEASLFDDQDRRLDALAGGLAAGESDGLNEPVLSGGPPAPTTPPVTSGDPPSGGARDVTAPRSFGVSSLVTGSPRAGQPQLDGRGDVFGADDGSVGQLEALEAQLKSRAKSYGARAAELEQRARQMR